MKKHYIQPHCKSVELAEELMDNYVITQGSDTDYPDAKEHYMDYDDDNDEWNFWDD